MKKLALAIPLILSSTLLKAEQFKPDSNISIEYDAITIETDRGYNSEADVFSLGYNWYYDNNISTKILFGMGKGDSPAYVNGVNTGDNAKVKFLVSADIRYEVPLTNNFSTYALLGASYIDVETVESILNERRSDYGLKLGVGASYAISKRTALYAEVKQDVYKDDFEAQSWTVGFKFGF